MEQNPKMDHGVDYQCSPKTNSLELDPDSRFTLRAKSHQHNASKVPNSVGDANFHPVIKNKVEKIAAPTEKQ